MVRRNAYCMTTYFPPYALTRPQWVNIGSCNGFILPRTRPLAVHMYQYRPKTVIPYCIIIPQWFNSLRPRRNRRHFADDVFKCNLLNENVWIPIKLSLKFVPKGPINNIPSLVQIMVWFHPCVKPLSEQMMVSFLTHICITRPQWVKW